MRKSKTGKTTGTKATGTARKKPVKAKRRTKSPADRPGRITDRAVSEQRRMPSKYGLWEHDLVTGELWWSDELYRIFGLERHDGITLDRFLATVHPKDRGLLRQTIETNKPSRQDYRIILSDKTLKHIHEEVHIQTDAVGRPVRVMGTAEDVTEQRRLEGELQREKLMFQAIVDAELECVKMLAADGSLLMMNPAGLAMIQAESFDQVRGRCVYPLVDEPYREAFKRLAEGVFRGGKGTLEFEMIGLKGRRLRLETYAVPLRDENGEIFALLSVTRDITERKRAEEALDKIHASHEALIQAIPDMVFFKDRDGRYQVVNRAMERSMGRSASHIVGKTDAELSSPSVAAACRQSDQEAIDRGEPQTSVEYYVDPEGVRRSIETVKAPIYEKNGDLAGIVAISRDITERTGAEEALRKSEDQLAQAQSMAHVGNWEWDVLTNQVFWSDEVFRIYGYAPRTVSPDYDLVLRAMHPETKDQFLSAIDAALRGERPFEMDYAFVTPQGAKKTLHTIGRVLRDEAGKPLRMVGTVQDVTDRQRVDAALRESESRFRSLFENAPDAEFLADAESGLIIDVNAAACALLDLPRERIIGMHQAELHPPEEREQMKALFDRHVAQAEDDNPVDPGDALVLRSDGTTVPVEISSQQTLLRGRKVMIGVFRDVSRRKEAELMVRNILETVDEAFIIIDRDFNVLSANRAYGVQAGRPVEEIIGRKCYEISHGISRPCYEVGEECAVRRVLESGEPSSALHTHYDDKKNPIYVETKAFPLKDAVGRVTAAIEIVNNITEKKKLEEQLRQAQKMEAVGLLAGGVAHDFNNILTAIIGYGNLLDMKLASDDPLRSYVEQVLASAARAANLTQSLLAFSRKQIINPRPMDVNDIITRIAKLLRRVIGEDVELKLDLSPGSLAIVADPSQMEQVLMNLCTNARDAMPGGGTLSVVTGTTRMDQEFRQEHGFGKDGAYARIAVTDTGTGMDEQTRERIFEPFFTTKELGRGTGLGLAIVYGIVKQNNGFVSVASEPGSGTTFTLYFPQVAAVVESAAASAKDRAPLRGSGTVLLAEDDQTLRTLIKTILTQFGYDVVESADGQEAIERFSEHPRRFDLLVLDVVMPRKNGRQAFEAIRALRPGIKTLFMSGYSDEMIDRTVLEDDGCRFIAKPVSPADLLKTIRDILPGN